MRKRFHFMAVTAPKREYQLVRVKSFDNKPDEHEVVMAWPMSGYSREKALNRADRFVGEQVRQSEAGTSFTYTQDVAKI